MLALVSPDYMTSAVCQEEFNLAMAQHLAKVTWFFMMAHDKWANIQIKYHDIIS